MARPASPVPKQVPRLPAWGWIIIIPLVFWLALLLVLVSVGIVPLPVFGSLGLANNTPIATPDQSARVLKGHTAAVKGVAFSPDSTTLASVGDEAAGRLKLWRVADGTLLYSVDAHKGGARCVAFSPSGKLLATGGQDGVVRLWNAADGTAVGELTGAVADLTSVAFSPDGRMIAASSWGRSWAGAVDTVHLWRVDGRTPLLQLNGNPRVSTSVSFSLDGQYLAAGGDDYNDNPGVYIWRLPDGTLVQTMGRQMSSWALTFAPPSTPPVGESVLVVAAGQLTFVKVPSGTIMRSIGYEGGASSLAFSPDGQLLATGSWDNTVRLWRVADGTNVQIWRGHSTYVESVAFSPDGKTVASGSLDYTVRLWPVPVAEVK